MMTIAFLHSGQGARAREMVDLHEQVPKNETKKDSERSYYYFQ